MKTRRASGTLASGMLLILAASPTQAADEHVILRLFVMGATVPR